MKTIGGYMFIFGIGSIALHFFNMEFVILSWIDTWGPTVGWAIRGGLAIVGAALWLICNSQASATATE